MERFSLSDIISLITPKYKISDENTSEFDLKYLSKGHGGVAVNKSYHKEEPYKNYKIQLKKGVNEVPLLRCSTILDITSIVCEPRVTLKLTKKSQINRLKTCTTDNLFTCRTMFIAYRDALISLIIEAPVDCEITLN